jgi:hypothetical protein
VHAEPGLWRRGVHAVLCMLYLACSVAAHGSVPCMIRLKWMHVHARTCIVVLSASCTCWHVVCQDLELQPHDDDGGEGGRVATDDEGVSLAINFAILLGWIA